MFRIRFGLILVLVSLIAVKTQEILSSHDIQPSPAGGMDVSNTVIGKLGNEKANVVASATKVENTLLSQPLSIIKAIEVNSHGHGVGVEHSETPGVSSTFKQEAHVNLLNTVNHNLNAQAFHSQTRFNAGPKLDANGVGLNYQHAAGHGAALSASHIPQLHATAVDAGVKANLWKSRSGQSTLDAYGGARHWVHGPMQGRTMPHGGVIFRTRF